MLKTIVAAAALALSALVIAPQARAQTPICQTNDTRVSVDFPGGGRHTCRVTDAGEIILDVVPEGRPINGSPWYAFRLDASADTRARITLDYGDYEHRYAPKYTRDGVNWASVRSRDVIVAPDERRVTINLAVGQGLTFIAAQPIETPSAVHAWARATLAPHRFEQVEYGRSIDGQPLVGYRGGEGGELIVALTRQHPPETTGAVAFRAFVERIMGDTPEARAFRARHRIVLAPMPNPDGVVRGHWRWGNGGLDLNRDWREFTQPETRALRDFILAEAQNRRTIAFFDFHSTRRNVVYAPPLDADSPSVDFLPLLRERLDRAVDNPLPWTFSHSETGNTAKRWSLEALRAPGLTMELDDEATQAQAQRIGRAVADALMGYALQGR
jgi:hypothetical protein